MLHLAENLLEALMFSDAVEIRIRIDAFSVFETGSHCFEACQGLLNVTIQTVYASDIVLCMTHRWVVAAVDLDLDV